jgi:DNA-binding SARP family transcriptional activator
VHVTVARLRHALGDKAADVVRTVPQGYLLAASPEQIDAHRFAAGIEAGRLLLREGRPEEAREQLVEALALRRGPALADVADETFARPEIAILDEQRLVALEARIDADLRLGRERALVPEVEGLVTSHPTRERLAEQLMLALYRSGRQTEALDVYQRAHRHLAEAFGVQPGPALQALQREILDQAPSLIPAEPVRAAATLEPPRPLAWARASDAPRFVGRAAEMARIESHLGEVFAGATRATMVSGEAGIGKTRLLAELMDAALAAGGRVFYGGGYESGALSYQPFAEALEPYVTAAAPQMRADGLEDALGELARLMPGVRSSAAPRDPFGDPEIQPSASSRRSRRRSSTRPAISRSCSSSTTSSGPISPRSSCCCTCCGRPAVAAG